MQGTTPRMRTRYTRTFSPPAPHTYIPALILPAERECKHHRRMQRMNGLNRMKKAESVSAKTFSLDSYMEEELPDFIGELVNEKNLLCKIGQQHRDQLLC